MNVREMAHKTNTTEVIERATSFHVSLERVWDIEVKWNPRLKTSYGQYARDQQIAADNELSLVGL